MEHYDASFKSGPQTDQGNYKIRERQKHMLPTAFHDTWPIPMRTIEDLQDPQYWASRYISMLHRVHELRTVHLALFTWDSDFVFREYTSLT